MGRLPDRSGVVREQFLLHQQNFPSRSTVELLEKQMLRIIGIRDHSVTTYRTPGGAA